jgi:hypothetical protein
VDPIANLDILKNNNNKKEVSCLPLLGFDPCTAQPIAQDRTLITSHGSQRTHKIYAKIPLKYITTFLFHFRNQANVAVFKHKALFSSLTVYINPLAYFTACACLVRVKSATFMTSEEF